MKSHATSLVLIVIFKLSYILSCKANSNVLIEENLPQENSSLNILKNQDIFRTPAIFSKAYDNPQPEPSAESRNNNYLDKDNGELLPTSQTNKKLSRFEAKNSISNFYFSDKGMLKRKVFADSDEDESNTGFSLDNDDENSTIISFLRFDRTTEIGNNHKSEFVSNWDWNAINETANVIESNIERTFMKFETKRSPLNDILSKNITILLENLLKNYENSQLPTHGKGYPTIVQTNMLIRSMGPVSELDMDYSMDCYFRQYWRDARLSFLGPIKSLSLSIKMLERIWRPDTYFYNGKHSYVHTITVPNKLLRINQDGDILYSMRLTIKAKCPMELRNFPMDRQSCPLILGSYAYTNQQLVYQWKNSDSVTFVPGMTLSQFDLMSFPYRNFTFTRREGDFSVLQVSFNLSRHTGYFLIQVYVPCILIVVLSWVSFWIHREATSDRVGLGITTVLTLSTISLDSRKDLPKVRYATALDWFLLMSFGYCIATLLEFAGVHYFTKVGSGEIPIDDDEWDELIEETGGDPFAARQLAARRRSSNIHRPSLIDSSLMNGSPGRSGTGAAVRLTMERTTQTEYRVPQWRQVLYCLAGDDSFRRKRQREAENGKHGSNRHINSVSHIDRAARVLFPASFGFLNLFYWVVYVTYQEDFKWTDPPIHSLSH